MSKYSDEQLGVFLAHEQMLTDMFLQRLEQEDEELFKRYIYRLLLKIYELNRVGRYLTKMQACRLIPFSHQHVCQLYVDEAEKKGLIELRDNPKDGRKLDVIPKKALLEYVEERLNRRGDDMRTAVASAASNEAFPRDNLPLSRWKAPA